MYITKGIIFSQKDLPSEKKEVKEHKCPKCNTQSYQKYCGNCGSQIKLTHYIKDTRLDIYNFAEKFDLLGNLSLEVNNEYDKNSEVCLYLYKDMCDMFITSQAILSYTDEVFENKEEVKKVIDVLKEFNIPYKIDLVVVN